MIVVDRQLEMLEQAGTPIRVGLVGAGFAGRGFMLQMLTAVKGMRLVAVSNRTRANSVMGCSQAGFDGYKDAETLAQLESIIESGGLALTDNPFLLTASEQIDVVVEATGEVVFGAEVVLSAINHGKHVVLINAELDSTLGPILKVRADQQGVVYTQADGDQPGVLMNLLREARFWGFNPVMVGNVKSLLDVRRTPATQQQWAEEHFQEPKMVTSFADGTKIGAEMASIANATGFPVAQRGMLGPRCDRVEDAYQMFDLETLLTTGLTDYVIGAEPSFGVFILATCDQPIRARYMDVYKMGNGPLYTFYRPYHLSPLEAPASVARAVAMRDVTLAPAGKPVCDVVTLAKRDIKAGECLDGVGGYLTYGAIDNYATSLVGNLLPIGLADGCIATRDLPMDTPVTYADVDLPPGRLADALREEQNDLFFTPAGAAAARISGIAV